jgi:hypothetical protein
MILFKNFFFGPYIGDGHFEKYIFAHLKYKKKCISQRIPNLVNIQDAIEPNLSIARAAATTSQISLLCTALHCTALHCTALPCTALHCTAPAVYHHQTFLLAINYPEKYFTDSL